MKNTKTSFDIKVRILSDAYLTYSDTDNLNLVDFCSEYENQVAFLLATNILVGYAEPTKRGKEVINDLFDELSAELGITENYAWSSFQEYSQVI
jgi:hypothetical protein